MGVIPFYGSHRPDLFAIERAAMDRHGHVLAALDRLLPRSGTVLDIGAGNGFTARRLQTAQRRLLLMEPAWTMIDATCPVTWLCGEAEFLPFAANSLSAAYATWAYFFPSSHPIDAAVAEAERVVVPGGTIIIANNLGGDEFCALAERDITEPSGPFFELGFHLEVVETEFRFESLHQAESLLAFYFGEAGRRGARLSLTYRVALFHKTVG